MAEKLGKPSASEIADENQESPSITIADRLTRVLSEMGQPLYWQDIHSLAETDGLGEINTNSAISALNAMARRGMIVGISGRVYSLPEFADKKYEPPRITIKARIDAVLGQAGRSLQVQEISSQIEEDGHSELLDGSIRVVLHQMTRAKTVIRTGRGFYCLPEFAVEKYESPEITLIERAIAILWRAGRPMHWQEVQHLTETDNLSAIKSKSMSQTLAYMVRKNLIARTERGIYSLPEFSYASDKKPNAYVTKAEILGKVVNILNEIGGSASIDHIYLLLTTGNLKGLSPKKVSDMLNRMAQEDKVKRKIVRITENTYCLPELADQEYEEPPFKIRDRLLEIFQATLRPLHIYETYLHIEEDERGALRMNSIQSALTMLIDERVIVRVARGVYSMPEFADEYYELPKLTLSLRVYFALLEAGRPLHTTEVRRLVNLDSQDEIVLQKIGAMLVWMTEEKKAVRLETGIYSLPEFAARDYELPVRMTIYVRLVTALKEAGRPLHRSEICRRAEEDGYGPIDLGRNTEKTFARITREGVAVRVSPGVYSMPEFADRDYELPKIAVSIRLITVLKEAGQPLHWQEAHRKAEEDGYGPIKPSSANSELVRMTKKGTVIRVKQSIYSMPEFADKQN